MWAEKICTLQKIPFPMSSHWIIPNLSEKTASALWIDKILEHGAPWVCECGCVGQNSDKEGKFDLKW